MRVVSYRRYNVPKSNHTLHLGDAQKRPVIENTSALLDLRALNPEELLKACSTDMFSCKKLQEAICMCVSV